MVGLPFIQARNYTPTNGRTIRLIVVHDMEHPEIPGAARAVAKWFAGTSAPQASAHYCIDDTEIIQCVRDQDVAWHAPGANSSGIGLEHAGYARQTGGDWADPYSTAMLQRSARLTAELCGRYQIPIRFVAAVELVAGQRGITTHAEVSKAWRRTNHTDPGPNFPMAHYINLVRLAGAPAPAPPPPAPSGSTYDYEETTVKTVQIHVGPLDSNGRGWSDWQPGLGRDPVPVAVTLLGPSPPDDGYWEGQSQVQLSAQPRGGALRVVVRNGKPGDTVTAFVTVA